MCRYRRRVLYGIILVALLGSACSGRIDHRQHADGSQRYIIAVVGNGVDSTAHPDSRALPLETAQGLSMLQGAQIAFAHAPECSKLQRIARLVPYEDAADTVRAAAIARRLSKDPRVLAVIGHATSATTRAGASLYAETGIPLVMPIATSPTVFFAPRDARQSQRLTNCYRLPPADVPAQANAVARFVLDSLRSRRCWLVVDTTGAARQYSRPLAAAVRSALADIIKPASSLVGDGSEHIPQVAKLIRDTRPDVVVFCGYGSTATQFLGSLASAYDKPAEGPHVVLTDGCKVPTLNTHGLPVFLTFPLPPGNELPGPNTIGINAIHKFLPPRAALSYQSYGYDALALIAQAIGSIPPDALSRATLAHALSSITAFRGTACLYTFSHGENSQAPYYVLRVTQEGDTARFALVKTLSPGALYGGRPKP